MVVSNGKDKDKYSNTIKRNGIVDEYIVGSLYSSNNEEMISFE